MSSQRKKTLVSSFCAASKKTMNLKRRNERKRSVQISKMTSVKSLHYVGFSRATKRWNSKVAFHWKPSWHIILKAGRSERETFRRPSPRHGSPLWRQVTRLLSGRCDESAMKSNLPLKTSIHFSKIYSKIYRRRGNTTLHGFQRWKSVLTFLRVCVASPRKRAKDCKFDFSVDCVSNSHSHNRSAFFFSKRNGL